MRTLTVCGASIAEFTIVIPTFPLPAEKTAAEFLQRVIEVSCGVKLAVSDTKTAHSIVLGSRDNDPDIKWDGFRTKTDANHLYLFGNEARGTLYSAYDFAEKYIGYRYFAYDLEVIPTEDEAEVPRGLDRIDNPVFQTRQVNWLGAREVREYASVCRFNTLDIPESEYANRFNTKDSTSPYGGNAPTGGCHTFDALCPSALYFGKHPEYYSLIFDENGENGTRIPGGNIMNSLQGQLCLTNPDVLRIVTENVLNQLRAHPETQIVDVSQNDNNNYCQCERCAAIDAEEESHSGTLIRFVNAVAEAVEKEFPHVLVHTLAYTYSRKAPKITKARHNVLVRYCTIEACFRHPLRDESCERNHLLREQLLEWKDKAHLISIWNYITNYACYMAPFPDLIANRDNIRFFADCHAIHLYEDGSCEGGPGLITHATGTYADLKMYLISKLMWNPYMSDEEYERHMTEFLKAFYGEGWREIRRYIDIEHEATADHVVRCFAPVDITQAIKAATPELLEWFKGEYEAKPYQPANPENPLVGLCNRIDEVKSLWNAAYEKAETDTQRMHIDRSRMAIDYLELYCIKHDKNTMSEEERAAYEAACAEFLRKKDLYNLHYNIWTQRYHAR